ncbi:uncharacterized protein METZ01_LOCUS2095 [marine metagenome]|uniref:Uncharacterized protein n=1 Tax=marine metagenome TaxID=408172 RepID=A0A381N3S0_9ZZZZ
MAAAAIGMATPVVSLICLNLFQKKLPLSLSLANIVLN